MKTREGGGEVVGKGRRREGRRGENVKEDEEKRSEGVVEDEEGKRKIVKTREGGGGVVGKGRQLQLHGRVALRNNTTEQYLGRNGQVVGGGGGKHPGSSPGRPRGPAGAPGVGGGG